MLAAARESGKLFSSIAQNRFRTPIAAFKALLDSGLAGPVKHFQVDSFWWRGHLSLIHILHRSSASNTMAWAMPGMVSPCWLEVVERSAPVAMNSTRCV